MEYSVKCLEVNILFHSKSMPAIKRSFRCLFSDQLDFSVQTGLPSFELVFVRCICATLFLALCWLVTGQYKTENGIKRSYTNISMRYISRF